jgi:hypothetical protein
MMLDETRSPPRAWYNDGLEEEEEERVGISGVAPCAQRREMKRGKVKGKGVVTLVSSPTQAKIEKLMQEYRDKGVIVRDGDEFPLVDGVPIGNPQSPTKKRPVLTVPPVGGDVEYHVNEVVRKAVLCPMSSTVPVKLAEWNSRYVWLSGENTAGV